MAKKKAVKADAAPAAQDAAPAVGAMDPEALARAMQGGSFAGYVRQETGGFGAGTGTTTYTETKPAEPSGVVPAGTIAAINITTARPAWEAPNSDQVAGAGDPQNGMLLNGTVGAGEGIQPRYIAWVDITRDVAQHYPLVEA
jgi:hypothetical protein